MTQEELMAGVFIGLALGLMVIVGVCTFNPKLIFGAFGAWVVWFLATGTWNILVFLQMYLSK